MQTSSCKDLVVWKPPPQCEVILDTRRAYNDYVSAMQSCMNFDSNYDYVYHMAELGEVITAALCRKDEFDKSLSAVASHHRAMLPSVITDTDAITWMSLKFQALATDVYNKAQLMRLYNSQNYLPFFFKNWHAGCLLLAHMTY